MTDTLHSRQAPAAPAPTTHTDACAAELAARARREIHVLRLHKAPRKHGGFTTRLHSGTLVIARDGYVVPTGADRVRLPADTTYGMFNYALDMLLTRQPRVRAIRAQEAEGHIDLELVDTSSRDERTPPEGTAKPPRSSDAARKCAAFRCAPPGRVGVTR
ncbi:hypothetical protein FNH09_46160 [Streptomyces adustus]|uniref:Uncharacterized protein n=1 Tax=Streptomyces adustus TaxID=1609272 RepID=A0A5N8VTL5_9ACTN|nr:hypothetical protein [Streptomyces adustus]MPY38329.1 hypothetical protein [Streptomyces adustus]